MKRKVRQFFLIGLVIFVSTAVLSWPSVLRYLIQTGLQEARRGGKHLSWSGLSTGMKSASFDSLTLWFPSPKIQGSLRIPVSIELKDTTVALNGTHLLTFRPSLTYGVSLYGGSVQGEALLVSDGGEITATLENVEVGQHPQMAALGVRGGSLNGSINQVAITPKGPTSGTFSLSMRQLTPPTIGAAKTLLRIDSLGPFDLDTSGSITPEAIEISNIKVNSKFGSASGRLTARKHLSDTPSLSGDIRVSMTEQGITTLGPWLPLIPGAGLNSETSEFFIKIATIPCARARPDTLFLDLGGQCAKLSFSPG